MVKFLIGVKNNHPLAVFIAGRILSMCFILFLLGFAVFALMSLIPGDIVDSYVNSQLAMSEFKTGNNSYSKELVLAMKHRLGLDLPFYRQYFRWLNMVFVHHDLGTSLISKAPILFLIKGRLINSLVLNVIELFVITILSFWLGIIFSAKAGTKIDSVVGMTGLFFNAFPPMLLYILLQLFAAATGWFPVTGYPDFTFSSNPLLFVVYYLYSIFLPLLGVFLVSAGATMRMIRATMLDQLGQPYILALRARGVSEKRIYFSHAFKNTLNPYITGSSNLLAGLFSGSLILEIIFSYPGIGKLMYEAVMQKDINLVLANIMFVSALVLVGMIITDIILAIVDPRIKFGNR